MKLYTVLTESGITGKTIAEDLSVGDYGMIQWNDQNGNAQKTLATVKEIIEEKELWK